jgi:Meckel syndrome type 1 protein
MTMREAGMRRNFLHIGLRALLGAGAATLTLLAIAVCAPWSTYAQVAKPEAQDVPQNRRSAAQLEQLVAPYAGVPSDALVVIFDAARFPSEITEAAGWLRKPEAERAAQPGAQPSVRLLTREAPEVVAFLASNMAATAALGSAYQEQPDDLWKAYGETTLRLQAQQGGAAPPSADAAALPDAPSSVSAAAPTEGAGRENLAAASPAAALPAPPADAAAPGAQPRPSEPAAAPPPVVVTPAPAPAPIVVTPAPAPVVVTSPAPATVVAPVAPTTTSGGDTTTAALTGGAIGLVGGMALGALLNENRDDDWGHSYPAPYPYPRPYPPPAAGYYSRPPSGTYAGASPQADARQAQRQASAAQMQQSRQAATAERQQQRQAAAGQAVAQSPRPTPSRPTPAAAPSPRPTPASASARSPAAAQATRQAPARQPTARSGGSPTAASAAPRPASSGWGPTVGMSGGGRAPRGGPRRG